MQRDKNAPLDKPEVRRGDVFTPFEQAYLYRCSMLEERSICTIVACNFEQFWFYDLMTDDGAKGKPCTKVTLEEIPDNLDLFKDLFERGEVKNGFEILKPEYTRMAAKEVAALYDTLKKDVEKNPSFSKARFSEAKKKEFEEKIPLIVMRIVFLLFADNTSDDRGKIFKNHQFKTFLNKSTDPAHFTRDLLELFRCLNIETEEERADGLIPEELMGFPYVDGGLFEETVTFPSKYEGAFGKIRDLERKFKHWDEIDFSVFGPIMNKVFGECEHIFDYNTSRGITFLFIDELRAEFEEIKAIRGCEKREGKLKAFHDKLSSLQFFDPASGSMNFLTETYMELRDLEDEVIALENSVHNLDIEIKVSLSQFHGIELKEYGAMVARTALQIAREQALERSYERFKDSVSTPPHFLPLKDEAKGIVCGNALSMDWGDLVTPSKDLFIFGGISFAGKKSAKQQKELDAVFAPAPAGKLDYCAAWYYKAAKFLNGSGGSFAFMSNISMSQDVLVEKFFKPIFDLGWKISFAGSYPFVPLEEDKMFDEHSTVEIGFSQNKEDELSTLYDIIKEIYYWGR